MNPQNGDSPKSAGYPRNRLSSWLARTGLITLVTWFGSPTPGAAQSTTPDERAHPAIVYVSNGGGGITEVSAANNSVIATAPLPNTANGVAATPGGRRTYATNRDVGQVTVFDTTIFLCPIPRLGQGLTCLARSWGSTSPISPRMGSFSEARWI